MKHVVSQIKSKSANTVESFKTCRKLAPLVSNRNYEAILRACICNWNKADPLMAKECEVEV
jgi:hypothetical protein